MPLTNTFVRTVKPQATAKRYSDEKALYLEVSPAGGKLWRMKYRYADREKRLSFGQYPDAGLRDARERRDAARKLLAQDIDPGEKKKEQKRERIARAATHSKRRHESSWPSERSGRRATRTESSGCLSVTSFQRWVDARSPSCRRPKF